jgi:hypothetical protein
MATTTTAFSTPRAAAAPAAGGIMGTIQGLSLPTKIYGVLLMIGCVGTMFAPCNADGCSTGKASLIVMSLLFGVLWTWVIDKLYKSQWTKTAWVLTLLPIIGSILLLLVAFGLIAGFSVSKYFKGAKKPSDPKAN